MSKISAQISELDEIISGLEDVKNNTQDISNGVNDVCGQMDTCWDGKACEEFIARLRKQGTKLDNSVEVIEGFKKYAEEIREDLIEEDRRQQAIINEIVGTLSKIKNWFENLFS